MVCDLERAVKERVRLACGRGKDEDGSGVEGPINHRKRREIVCEMTRIRRGIRRFRRDEEVVEIGKIGNMGRVTSSGLPVS
jgi:hypothetical protein